MVARLQEHVDVCRCRMLEWGRPLKSEQPWKPKCSGEEGVAPGSLGLMCPQQESPEGRGQLRESC